MKDSENDCIPLLVNSSAIMHVGKDKKADLKASIYHRRVYPNKRGSEDAKMALGTAALRARLQQHTFPPLANLKSQIQSTGLHFHIGHLLISG